MRQPYGVRTLVVFHAKTKLRHRSETKAQRGLDTLTRFLCAAHPYHLFYGRSTLVVFVLPRRNTNLRWEWQFLSRISPINCGIDRIKNPPYGYLVLSQVIITAHTLY
jgi:hypothetical protein